EPAQPPFGPLLPEHAPGTVPTVSAALTPTRDAAPVPSAPARAAWEAGLAAEAQALLTGAAPQVWNTLMRRVEGVLIRSALDASQGRRIDAAQRLGIGRNTLTRKLQELDMADKNDHENSL